LKVGEFANAEGGRFASDPAQVTIEKLEPGQVGCEDAPSARQNPNFQVEAVYAESLDGYFADKNETPCA